MKALRTAEHQVDSHEKKLESYTEELNGIQNVKRILFNSISFAL